MKEASLPPGFQDMLAFGLVEALLGRRSRRFCRVEEGGLCPVGRCLAVAVPPGLAVRGRYSRAARHLLPRQRGGQRLRGRRHLAVLRLGY